MTDLWLTALLAHEHQFFPERFSDDRLVHALKDDSMPEDTRARLADELLSRETFDVDATIRHLQIDWWGDDPMGCRRAWEALENAKARR